MDALSLIYKAVDYLTEIENQDRTQVIQMSQAMLNDYINDGEIKPLIEYIKRYCDVLDSPEDAQSITDEILA